MVSGVAMKVFSTEWSQEFEANSIGLQVMLAVDAQAGIPVEISYAGADLFFGIIDVVEKLVTLLHYGRERHSPEIHILRRLNGVKS